jgi:hypothetical protein
VFKDDPLDPVKGKLYRDKILRPGTSKDEMELLKVNPLISWSTSTMANRHWHRLSTGLPWKRTRHKRLFETSVSGGLLTGEVEYWNDMYQVMDISWYGSGIVKYVHAECRKFKI